MLTTQILNWPLLNLAYYEMKNQVVASWRRDKVVF